MASSSIYLPFGTTPTGDNVQITYANLVTAVNGCTLTPGTVYYIINRPSGDVYVQAIDNCTLAPRAFRGQLCPTVYDVALDTYGNNWVGVWRPELAAVAIGDLTIWGHAVWKNLTGAVGTAPNNYTLDATNWQLIPRSSYTNHEYTELFFEITYDLAHDWIAKQYDGKGNVIGMDYSAIALFGDPAYNPCDYTDWNMGTPNTPFFNNEVRQILNNFQPGGIWSNRGGEIVNNRCGGGINDNVTEWGIHNNKTAAQIELNMVLAIDNNSNNGFILANYSLNNAIQDNANNGNISNNFVGMITGNNAPCTDIQSNVAPGGIYSNSNAGVIQNNVVTGDISYNTVQGYITYNNNNGSIKSNTSTGVCNITKNSNNGDIQLSGRTASVSDAIVNK